MKNIISTKIKGKSTENRRKIKLKIRVRKRWYRFDSMDENANGGCHDNQNSVIKR